MTLTEMMVALAVLTIGVVSGMGSFKYINRAITQSRIKTISTNLVQEKMEVLRNKSYFQLLVTTAPATSSGYSPNFTYDTASYPPQTITLWGMPALTRVVNVAYVSAHGTDVDVLDYTANDSGMKKITVTVMWSDAGGTPRKVQMSSYYENPTATVLSAAVSGTVTDVAGGSPVPDALVQVMGSPNWRDYSDASGNYSFQVAPGSYTLVCSTRVYYSSTSVTVVAAAGATVDHDFSLTRIQTGGVFGIAYMRMHPVIYMVVASSAMVNGDQVEFVSLYNPTTSQINILTDQANPDSDNIKLSYYGEAGASEDAENINLIHRSTYIPSGYHYLIASTGTFHYGSITITADAVYDPVNPSCGVVGAQLNCVRRDKAGAIRISDANGNVLDTLGWSHTDTAKPAPYYEGTAYPLADGLEENAQLVRRTSSAGTTQYSGSCYDTDSNDPDFVWNDPATIRTMTRAHGYKTPVTGTPAAGAVVTATDGLSTSVKAAANGLFTLNGIATSTVQGSTNTWTINITSETSSCLVLGSSVGVTITPSGLTNLGYVVLSTSVEGGIAVGYVYGSGPDQNRPLGNPTIQVGAAGEIANTDSQGFYMLFLPTGTIAITANFASANGSYQTSYVEVDLAQGAVTNVPDFHLAQGGIITGYVTSGTGALPDTIVQATNGGPVYSGTSDSTGHFYISAATSSVAYEVTPVLDALQSYTSLPATPLSVDLAAPGDSVFAGTITVIGAMGTIEGVLTKAGMVITTGVLVVASTATVSDPLPLVNAASAPTQTVIYSVSSQADGTYSLDVRSSATETYNMRAYYPEVDANTGAVTYTTRTGSGISVSAGGITTQDFTW